MLARGALARSLAPLRAGSPPAVHTVRAILHRRASSTPAGGSGGGDGHDPRDAMRKLEAELASERARAAVERARAEERERLRKEFDAERDRMVQQLAAKEEEARHERERLRLEAQAKEEEAKQERERLREEAQAKEERLAAKEEEAKQERERLRAEAQAKEEEAKKERERKEEESKKERERLTQKDSLVTKVLIGVVPLALAGLCAAVWTWYHRGRENVQSRYVEERDVIEKAAAVIASAKLPAVSDEVYVPRPVLDSELADVVGRLIDKYVIVVGHRGTGKTTAIKRAAGGRLGVVVFNITTQTKAGGEWSALMSVLALPEDLHGPPNIVRLERILKRAKELHLVDFPDDTQWVPTIIATVDRNMPNNGTLEAVVNMLRHVSVGVDASCAAIVDLSDTASVFGLPVGEPGRQRFVRVSDLTEAEAKDFLDRRRCLMGDDESRRRAFGEVGRSALQLKSVAERATVATVAGKNEKEAVDAYVGEVLKEGRAVFDSFRTYESLPKHLHRDELDELLRRLVRGGTFESAVVPRSEMVGVGRGCLGNGRDLTGWVMTRRAVTFDPIDDVYRFNDRPVYLAAKAWAAKVEAAKVEAAQKEARWWFSR